MVVGMDQIGSIICSLLSWGDILWWVCSQEMCVQNGWFKINKNNNILLVRFKHTLPHIKCVLYMVCCSVQSVPHHFLFLEYMISLFLSPALEQHQYIYWSLSRMASEKKKSCCHSLVWFIVCDCGRRGSILQYSEWHVVVWYHYQAVEKGIVSFHSLGVHKQAIICMWILILPCANKFTVLLYLFCNE